MKTKILTIALIGLSFSSFAQDQHINGNLAIGASNRTDIGTLHVTSSDTSVNPVIRIESSNDSDLSFIRFQAKNSSSSNKYSDILFDPNTGNLAFKNPHNSSERMTIKANGNIGIGTTSPSQKLEVKGSLLLKSDSYVSYTVERGNGAKSAFGITSNTHDGFLSSSGNLKFLTNNNGTAYTTSMLINSEGNVGIGTTNPSVWRLAVNGKIRAKEIKVETGWSDFVFYDDYKLSTLQEVENHIKEKGHLKDIPSAKEVAENGIFLGEMDSKLLQKIEELTLYTIQQEKKINNLEKQNSRIENLEKEIKSLNRINSKFIELQKRLEKLENK